MGECVICLQKARTTSEPLGLCRACIEAGGPEVDRQIDLVHRATRWEFRLPETPPADPDGLLCRLCANRCRTREGKRGFCGTRRNVNGHWGGGGASEGLLSWYLDPLPTNCVGDWVCPANTDAGYPQFTDTRGPEYGHKNLAVFYQACSFNCLYCQNWHFRQSHSSRPMSPSALAECVDEQTRCVCYFGGDPTPQLPHSLWPT